VAALLDLDHYERPSRRVVAVLRVLRLQELERPRVPVHDARAAAQPHPGEARPVLVVAVDQYLDARVALDVGEPREPAGALRLLVYCGVERGAVEDEADRDDARRAVGPDRGQARDAGVV
jgi:hypothetical protein